jgi:hypothetical protein
VSGQLNGLALIQARQMLDLGVYPYRSKGVFDCDVNRAKIIAVDELATSRMLAACSSAIPKLP